MSGADAALRVLAGPLRVHVAVADHGHVTRAAAQLRLQQPTASRAPADLDRGVRAVQRDDSPATGRVALGFLHPLGAGAVPALVRAHRARHPGARSQLTPGAAGALLERLGAGEVDLVLTSPLPRAAAAFRDLVLARPELLVAGLPLSDRR